MAARDNNISIKSYFAPVCVCVCVCVSATVGWSQAWCFQTGFTVYIMYVVTSDCFVNLIMHTGINKLPVYFNSDYK